VAILLAGTSVVVASPAQAAPGAPAPLDGWCDLGEACLYYNSNLAGGIYDVTWNIWNYAPARFSCSWGGTGTICAGAGQQVWNNAASVRNNNEYCDLAIFYNSNYHGYVQVIPRRSWANLDPTLKNNNASQEWIHC
jgi:hypothetical protein